MLLTFATDSVQCKGNLVFAVRQKQGVVLFDEDLLEIIGYQSDAAHGTEGIIYLNPYLFGRSFSVVGLYAYEQINTTNRSYQFTAYEDSIFHCLQALWTTFSRYRCYIFVPVMLIRILFKDTSEVNQVFPTACRVTGSSMASRISSIIDRKCSRLNLNSE